MGNKQKVYKNFKDYLTPHPSKNHKITVVEKRPIIKAQKNINLNFLLIVKVGERKRVWAKYIKTNQDFTRKGLPSEIKQLFKEILTNYEKTN